MLPKIFKEAKIEDICSIRYSNTYAIMESLYNYYYITDTDYIAIMTKSLDRMWFTTISSNCVDRVLLEEILTSNISNEIKKEFLYLDEKYFTDHRS